MKIQSADLIDYASVEVIGKQGRKTAEFVVHFSRRGAIKDGYQFAPEEGYLYAESPSDRNGVRVLPDEVKAAATNAYNDRYTK